MNNTDIEKLIVESLAEEDGEYLGLNSKILDSGLDSFGIVMVLHAINEEFPFFTKLEELGIEEITWQDVKDRHEAN